MNRKKRVEAMKAKVVGMVLRDADKIAGIVADAMVDYNVKDAGRAWENLLKNPHFIGAIDEILATIPRKHKC